MQSLEWRLLRKDQLNTVNVFERKVRLIIDPVLLLIMLAFGEVQNSGEGYREIFLGRKS